MFPRIDTRIIYFAVFCLARHGFGELFVSGEQTMLHDLANDVVFIRVVKGNINEICCVKQPKSVVHLERGDYNVGRNDGSP